MPVLVLEQFYGQCFKICRGSSKYPFFEVNIFNGVFQFLFSKFDLQNTKMRYSLLISILALSFISCNKDKYTTAPQLVFKSFSPNEGSNHNTFADQPVMILEITDAEGDLGFIKGKDTAKVYIKNMLTLKEDSMFFPDLQAASKSNFKASIEIGLYTVMGGRSLPLNQRPYSDNLQFEVYVKDFAKNKSNVILTDKPFTFYTLP